MTLRCSLSGEGMSLGVQIGGGYFDEATLFRVAAQVEADAVFKTSLPPLTS